MGADVTGVSKLGTAHKTGTNRLEWHEDMPYSAEFGDHYYSKADGRAECGHVFLTGNGLPDRWKGAAGFTIAELGFGTGLNFVETWRHWKLVSRPPGKLTFVSFERFPLRAEDMKRALGAWPELSEFAQALVDSWPSTPHGVLRMVFDETVTLEVHIGDVQHTLPLWNGRADAWFLDGFAPARNKDMWNEELMRSVFAHTAGGGTFATYTAAGWVRRNLEAAGFDVRKVPGFAGKRDMTLGVRPQ